MFFANGILLLFGGLLVAAPIVLHLLMQPKAKPLTFPAMRFLQTRQLANQRQMRIRHWILLALRVLLIALLALALAGPAVAESGFGGWVSVLALALLALLAIGLAVVTSARKESHPWLQTLLLAVGLICLLASATMAWRTLRDGTDVPIGRSADPVAALIVFDNTPRMTYLRENQSHLERGKEMAEWVLSQLPPDSRIAVMETRNEEPFYSVDIAAAQKRLTALDVNYLPLSLPDLLRRGLEFLRDAEQTRREIYLITDRTRASWQFADDGSLRRQLEQQGDVSLFLIDVGTDSPVNLSINDLRLDADRLTTTSRLAITATLSTTGDTSDRTLEWEIEKPDPTLPVIQDGKTLLPGEFWRQAESVTISGSGTTALDLRFGQSLPIGIHHGRLSIVGGDGLALDNQRMFTVEITKSWPVLVVHPNDVNPVNLTEILTPATQRETGGAPFEIQATTPDSLAQYDLGQYQSIYLLDPPPLAEADWSRLLRYVEQGGGLALFLGSQAGTGGRIADSFVSPVARDLLGGEVTTVWRRTDGDLTLRPTDVSHPIFKLIRGQESALAWFQFPVFYHWGFEPSETARYPTQVLLRYSNQQPAVVETLIGQGRVLTMTTPITEPSMNGLPTGRPFGAERDSWNRLFSRRPLPAWLLVRQLTQYLAQLQTDTLNLETGQFARLKNDPRAFPETYALFTPTPDQPPTRVSAIEGQITYKFTDLPGHYRLKGSREGEPVLRGFSANLPSSATDLTRIPISELEEFLGEKRFQIATSQTEIERQQGSSREGQEFYPLIMLILCVVFGLEYVMSNRFYGRRSDPS